MVKIKEIKGFKYIGQAPSWVEGFNGHQNFRKNLTYIRLSFSDWEKDKHMLTFIGEHVSVVEDLVKFIQEGIENHRYDVKKDFHIVIRQDDDNENLYGQELLMITSSKPIGVDKYIETQKGLYQRWEEGQNNRLRY